jgi:glutaredoxin
VDVKKDPSRLQEMLSLTNGTRQVPVIVENGAVKVGYGGS